MLSIGYYCYHLDLAFVEKFVNRLHIKNYFTAYFTRLSFEDITSLVTFYEYKFIKSHGINGSDYMKIFIGCQSLLYTG